MLLTLGVFLTGCAESSFILANESRLPRWYKIPEDKKRSDIKVNLSYYSWPSGGEASIKFKPEGDFFSKTIKGNLRGLAPIKIKGSTSRYEVITINGVTDIIEHKKREPVFYMTDDLNVWKHLNVVK